METFERDITEGLNAAQCEAVKSTEGPTLIVAGAGSGKTRVLTCRIAYLLQQGALPWEVLALTFTKKAAGEMKDRIGALVGESRARRIRMGTFHAVFIRFLREFAEHLGYPEQFTIYDQSDSRNIVKHCISELNLDDKIYKPASVQNRISLAKNNLLTPAGYRNNAQLMAEDRDSRRLRFVDVYALYVKKCKDAGAMDFDDILLKMNVLLNDAEICGQIASRFSYILVDEYQDTNYAQYLILKKLAEPHHNLCVVGDDSQSIYGFRGARVENILRFQKDFPESRIFRLEQNYRSTQTIVNAANSVIARNEHRIKKECFSMASQGEKIHVINAFTEQEEAYLISTSIIDRIYSDKAAYRDFAILYRTNAQSRAFEESLRRKNLPYRIYGGHSFFDRTEIKDALAYFKLVTNPRDDESLRRVINVPPRGIGDTTMQHLSEAAAAAGVPLLQAISLPSETLQQSGLKDAAVSRLRAFASGMMELAAKASVTDAFTLSSEIGGKTGLLATMKADTTMEGQVRYENLEELYNNIKQYVEEETEMRLEMLSEGETAETVTLGDFLENISLMSEVEKNDMREDESESDNKITLMTVHAAKGLEFPYVYIAGMEENLFPSDSLNSSLAEIEEERRLFYVALTRAGKAVSVSFAKNRMKWGKTESNNPSRFLREIDSRYLDSGIPSASRFNDAPDFFRRPSRPEASPVQRTAPKPVYKPAPVRERPRFSTPSTNTPNPDFKASPIIDLKAGQRVEHDRFGFGRIVSFEDFGPNRKAIVEFEQGGRKTLLLKFAKLRICQ